MALLIFIAFPLGLILGELPLSPLKLKLFTWHKGLGITILLLAVLRILWRITHPPPALPAELPRWQHRSSQGVHYFLYALIVAIPLSGWLMSSAKGVQTVWFGMLPLPDLIAKNKELGGMLKNLHTSLNYTLLGLVLLHLAAVVKHQWVNHDSILVRMLPRWRRRGQP